MARKKERVIVSCKTCKNATLVQVGSDPIIAYCKYSNYGEVASKPRTCSYHEQCHIVLPIEHFEKPTQENLFKKFKTNNAGNGNQ